MLNDRRRNRERSIVRSDDIMVVRRARADESDPLQRRIEVTARVQRSDSDQLFAVSGEYQPEPLSTSKGSPPGLVPFPGLVNCGGAAPLNQAVPLASQRVQRIRVV